MEKPNLHILHPKGGPDPGAGKFTACLLADGLVMLLQYTILVETFSLLGIEFSQSLTETPLIGWIFALAPDVTAQHLYAAMCAVLFVTVPIFAWITILEPSVLKIPKRAETVGRVLSIGVFAMIMIADFLAIWFRASVNAGGFYPKTDLEVALGAFFGLLAAALNVIATYWTAVVHITRALEKS